jgi:serine/threonine-protein kinase RsbW
VSRGRLLLRMELRSNPEVLCVVRSAVTRLAELLGFSDSDSHLVILALDEALTNIIRHAYRGQRERPIEVTFRLLKASGNGVSPQALEIVLLDDGSPADVKRLRPRPLQELPIEELKPGGLGLHFIRKNMDKVEFQRRDGRNLLRLVKALPLAESHH